MVIEFFGWIIKVMFFLVVVVLPVAVIGFSALMALFYAGLGFFVGMTKLFEASEAAKNV